VFAIIQASCRQFRVEPGAIIAIDGHKAAETGGEVSFDQVLLVSNDAARSPGRPSSPAPRSGHRRRARQGQESRVFKKKRPSVSSDRAPHLLTRVRITDIQV
jgi:ribosomal protein L21